MTEPPESPTLVYLRRIDEKLDSAIARQSEHTERLGRLEILTAGLHSDFAELSVRVDRVEKRLERVERRLDLQPA